jgi:hypothetical protein
VTSCIRQYYLVNPAVHVIQPWLGVTGYYVLEILVHPITHNNWVPHLATNALFGLIAGTLIESWMTVRCRTRLGILGLCYGSSVVADYMKWQYIGPTLNVVVGLSGMISAAIAVLLIYYVLFRHQIRLDRFGWLAPLGIGFLVWSFLIAPLYNLFFVPFQPDDSVNFHLTAFVVTAVPAYLLLRRSRASIIQQRS